jgi:hypothetical protein
MGCEEAPNVYQNMMIGSLKKRVLSVACISKCQGFFIGYVLVLTVNTDAHVFSGEQKA